VVSSSVSFAQVSSGFLHSCAVATDRRLFCWGGNTDGQLGDGSTESSAVPVAVGGGVSFASVSALMQAREQWLSPAGLRPRERTSEAVDDAGARK
jgi:hypothetical protein